VPWFGPGRFYEKSQTLAGQYVRDFLQFRRMDENGAQKVDTARPIIRSRNGNDGFVPPKTPEKAPLAASLLPSPGSSGISLEDLETEGKRWNGPRCRSAWLGEMRTADGALSNWSSLPHSVGVSLVDRRLSWAVWGRGTWASESLYLLCISQHQFDPPSLHPCTWRTRASS
jgi:hypothetical protein